MKRTSLPSIILCLLFLQTGNQVTAQTGQFWYAFSDEKTELIGFKDHLQVVKIEPVFSPYIIASRFEHILSTENYYYTKSGKIITDRTPFQMDNTPDCESEGFIRFIANRKTRLQGMLNRTGNVVIPATYNSLSRVQNGLVWALKGAQEECLDGECEYYRWKGGNQVLLDTNNHILIDSFPYNSNLDLYSIKISNQMNTEENRVNFKGVNGDYYSFSIFQQTFDQWFLHSFLESSFPDQVLTYAADSLLYYPKETGDWKTEASNGYLTRQQEMIKPLLSDLKTKKCRYRIESGELDWKYKSRAYMAYRSNCGEPLSSRYPVFRLLVFKNEGDQEVYSEWEFLKTNDRYVLIGLRFF